MLTAAAGRRSFGWPELLLLLLALGAVARACQKDVIRVIIVKKEDQDDSKGVDGEDDAAAADDGTRTKDIFDHVQYDA